MRESQWNLYQKKGWTKDTFEERFQCFKLLYGNTAVDVIDVHSYMNGLPGYVISDGKGGKTYNGEKGDIHVYFLLSRSAGEYFQPGEAL